MDVYRTEEEQVAAIQRWWKENYKVIVAAILLAVGTFGGWKWYQYDKQQRAQTAAGLYQGMMKSLQEITAGGDGVADADARLKRAGETLLADHGKSVYAQYAALLLAGSAVEKDDYAGAEKYLRSALGMGGDDATQAIIEHRLARVLSAQGKHDDALALLAGKAPEKLLGAREDVRGDVLLAQGKRGEAKAAYQKASDALEENDPLRSLLTMKLEYLAGE